MSSELETFYEQVGTATSGYERSGRYDDAPATPTAVGGSKPEGSSARGPVSAWAVSDRKYWGISHSIPTIDAGYYRSGFAGDVGVYLERQPIQTDSLIVLPDSKSEAIVQEIEQFMTLRPAFVSRGLLYKRGVLLWGPPGSGKTSTLHLLMRLIVDRLGGLALMVDHPGLAAQALQLVRKIEPERQIIAILEDIDGLLANYGVNEYLALLDGESQVDNIVFVATTNYPERLDRRFVDRPSRFDTVQFVGMPTADARRVYLTHKEPKLDPLVIEQMVDATEGLSIAHLREMIVLTQCFGRTIEDAAKRLTASKYRTPSSDRSPESFAAGFAGGTQSVANRLARGAERLRQGQTASAG